MDLNNLDAVLDDMMKINGALACSVIDWQSGMTLGTRAVGNFNIDLASAGNSEVVKAKMETMRSTGLHGKIQDMLITLTDQIHIITMIPSQPELCGYVVIDAGKANLALARNKMNTALRS